MKKMNNRIKSHFGIMICMALVMSLTGCASKIEIDDIQSAIIAEYIGGTVLKYDKNYNDGLIYPEYTVVPENGEKTDSTTPSEEPQVQPSESPQASKEPSNSQDTNSDPEEKTTTMTDLFHIKSLTVTYDSYEVCSQYPKEGTSVVNLTPSSGKQFLVLKFKLENQSKKKMKLDLLNPKHDFLLKIQDKKITPNMTILIQDLQVYEGTIYAGESDEAVLVFEVSKKIEVKDFSLYVKQQDGTYHVALNE